jgi:hypothetical protein
LTFHVCLTTEFITSTDFRREPDGPACVQTTGFQSGSKIR